MLPVQEADQHPFVTVIYTSTIGAILAFVISVALLCNLSCVFYKLWKKQRESQVQKKQKKAYSLALIYLILTTLASFSYAFIRTNTFTRIQVTQFTSYQCFTGLVFSYISYYISTAMLYIIFTWRIYTSFKDSAYEYNPRILYLFCVTVLVIVSALSSIIIYEAINAKWEVLEHEGISICINNAIDHSDFIKYSYRYLSLITASFHFVVSIILLYMFVAGLWSINKILMKSFITEYCPANTKSEIELEQENRSININTVLDECINDETRSPVQRNESIQNARQILILYGLVKKQTILVSISVSSSVLLWILIVNNDWISLQIYWDVIINVMCVWLMLGSSNKYWKWCTKSCLRCCYRKENLMHR